MIYIRWLGFGTKCPLRLNGWNDMGLTTHEWLVAYVFNYEVVAKSKMCCCDVWWRSTWVCCSFMFECGGVGNYWVGFSAVANYGNLIALWWLFLERSSKR